MNAKRAAAIVIGGGAFAAWLAGAAPSNRSVAEPIAFRPSTVETRGAELAAEIERLHERLRPTAAPRQPGRNLFAFRAAPAAAPPAAAIAFPALVETSPPPRPAPALKLAGIAEDPGPDGPVRTAIISGDGQLFLVKEGENVTSQYRVVRISVEVVELLDLVDGSSRRLALK